MIHPAENGPKGWYSRGYHPHCDFPCLVQLIGFRLYDSVPAELIARWTRELTTFIETERRAIIWEKIDRYADTGHGSCLLAKPEIAQVVEGSLLHFDGKRYDLLAWCVMSNHVHVLVAVRPDESLPKIVHSWKSFTAHQSNRILHRSGQFWMTDYYDEYMRTTTQLERTIEYIEYNPVHANLATRPEDWLFSSAAPRHRQRIIYNRSHIFEIDPQQLPDG